MTLAHIGLGVLILGITVQSAGQVERIIVMRPGDTVEMVGYQVRLDGVGPAQGPNYQAQRATFSVIARRREPVTVLHSERRYFPVERMPTTEAGIDTNLWRDLYFVLGDPADGGGFAVRLYYNPLVLWIWGGAGIMALAGVLSLTDRRLRVGAPAPGAGGRRRGSGAGLTMEQVAAPAGVAPAPAFGMPLAVFLLLGVFLAIGLTRDPSTLPSALVGKPAPEFSLPPLEGRDRARPQPRRPRRQADAGQRLRVLVRAVPDRASAADQRLAEQGVVVQGINYKDRPEDAQGLARRARRSLPAPGCRPRRPGRRSTGASTACRRPT